MFLNGGDALSGLGDAEGEHGMHKGPGTLCTNIGVFPVSAKYFCKKMHKRLLF